MMVMLKLEEQPVLIQAIFNGEIEDVRALLECKPDVNYQDAEKRSPLHAAAYKGDKDLAELLLGQGARVNTKDSSWLTPLHRACGVCADDMVELLLKYKADTTARDRQWQTPLHIAAAHNAIGCIQHLLHHVTNVNVTDRSGCTALHHAALHGHNEVVELLLAKGSIVNACDKKDCRPIHWAAHIGHVDTVSVLIQHGADINVKDRNQYTPLHAAVASGMVYVCNLLLNAGADVNAQNAFGNTPLHVACLNGHHSVCQILLSHSADLEAVNYKGQTPLHIAAASTQGVGCLAYLLEQENVDINRQSADGRTPLHMTAIYGRFTRSKRLIDKGAVVDCADRNGNTALHIAAQYGHDILTATLMDFGADPVKRGYEGRTPLHVCCLSGYVEVCRKYLQRSVDLDVVDDHGRTPIHCAAYKGSVECLDLLVSRGGNFQLQDAIGRTALHYAAVRGHYSCVCTLVGIGSPVSALDADGCSALHLAAAYDTEGKCVEYLLQHPVDVLLKDARGFTPVHYAVNGSNRAALQLLLRAVGRRANFLAPGMPATTPLHLAARRGDLHILRAVLTYFPETDVRTREGYTPLMLAAREGHTPSVQMLLRYGAKVAVCDDVAGMSPVHHSARNGHLHCLALLVDNAEEKAVIDRRDRYERTALMLAISGAHQDCAFALLKSSADPNVVDADLHSPLFRAVVTDQNSVVQLLIGCGAALAAPDCNGKTVLHLAAACGHLKCLQQLVRGARDADALALDKHGFSTLHWACYYGNASCLEYLLRRNIFQRLEGNAFTPVHCAAFTGSERCLELLHAKFGVECVRARDARHRTPLHLAAWHGHADCVRFLLDNGGEVEAKDEIGRSPLISAAQNGQSQVIDLLLAHKADLKSSDANGSTALHVACLRKHNHTALLLLEYIADAGVINMVDNDKKTALHLAARNGLVEVTAELIKKGASVVAADNNGLTPALYCAPNACVAQCLAIILAHHPAETPADGHTKECMRTLLRTLSRTSSRSSASCQASQTEISLLRNPHELFLVDMKRRRRRRRHTHAALPPVAAAAAANVSDEDRRPNGGAANVEGGSVQVLDRTALHQKNLILIENYDREEFDVSRLKRQKGLGLHRSYSDMALVRPEEEEQLPPQLRADCDTTPSKPSLTCSSIWDIDEEDRQEHGEAADDDDDDGVDGDADQGLQRVGVGGGADVTDATYRRLIDGYKTIALKMARVSSQYDVSVDDIQRAYARKRRERAAHADIGRGCQSCPLLGEAVVDQSCADANRSGPEMGAGGAKVAVEGYVGNAGALLEEHKCEVAAHLKRELELEAQQIEANYEAGVDVARTQPLDEEALADAGGGGAEVESRVPEKAAGTGDGAPSEYVTCGLPPYAPPAAAAPTPSLSFAAFAKAEASVSTGTDADVALSASSDALGHGDFLYENFCAPEGAKAYCDCQYVCKHCVLLNRYDYGDEHEELGVGACARRANPFGHAASACATHGGRLASYAKDALLGEERRCLHVDAEEDVEDAGDLIPLENLIVARPRVLVGEGAVRKSRPVEGECGRQDGGTVGAGGSSAPEKLAKHKVSKENQKLLKEKCEAEKARRKGGRAEQAAAATDGSGEAHSPTTGAHGEGLDLGLGFSLPTDEELNGVGWPKVTFDDGCIKMAEELEHVQCVQAGDEDEGRARTDGEVAESAHEEEKAEARVIVESPTRDLDRLSFAPIGELDGWPAARVKVRASASLTNVACGAACGESTAAQAQARQRLAHAPAIEFLDVATSATALISVVSAASCPSPVKSSQQHKLRKNKERKSKEANGASNSDGSTTPTHAPIPTEKHATELSTAVASSPSVPPSAGITSLASSFLMPRPAANGSGTSAALPRSGFNLNDIPSSLLAASHGVGACFNFAATPREQATTLLRDSAAIIDISAIFAKSAIPSQSALNSTSLTARGDDKSGGDVIELQRCAPRDADAELVAMVRRTQEQIQRFSYKEMVDLSEGLNMSPEAKAMARKLIEQLARQPQPPSAQESKKSVDSTTCGGIGMAGTASDTGSDLSVNSKDSGVSTVSTLSDAELLSDAVRAPADSLDTTKNTKKAKRARKQDDNKCLVQ